MELYEHGGRIQGDILDFSVNINPLGMPDKAKDVIREHIGELEKYPDTECAGLTRKLSGHDGVKQEKIVCGNGAADLIYRIVHALKPENALLTAPAFSEYEKALSEVGCSIRYHRLDEQNDFIVGEDILESLDGVDICFLCVPNNPNGALIPRELMDRICDKCQSSGTLLVLDECFLGFCKEQISPQLTENMIKLRAFTKLYAMAGLRLGYALCGSKAIAERIRRTGQCWSVSVPAQLAGAAALDDGKYLADTVSLISREREYLRSSLEKTGIKVYPSDCNFLLMKYPGRLDTLLLNKGIAVRSCSNFRGLDETYFRIAVRRHEENERLIAAINSITGE